MTRKTPQEKKALSYAKDRNLHGENDKSSRKAIPLRKRLVNRANRHQVQQLRTIWSREQRQQKDQIPHAQSRLISRQC